MSLVKPIKLDFLHFLGEDPASWMYKSNQYFRYYQNPIAEKLMIASFHIEQEAQVWFHDAKKTGVFSDWDSMVQALHVRFGSTPYDDPMEALIKLRQTSTVVVYKAEFEALSDRIKGLSPMHKLSCFLRGLNNEIQLLVRMLTP